MLHFVTDKYTLFKQYKKNFNKIQTIAIWQNILQDGIHNEHTKLSQLKTYL